MTRKGSCGNFLQELDRTVYFYKCPACDCLPVRYKRKPKTSPTCLRCSRTLQRVSNLKKGYIWALGLATAGMALLTLPDVLEHLAEGRSVGIIDNLQESLLPVESKIRQSDVVNTDDLLSQLALADRQWTPQEEILGDGSKRYLYKRRADEADLSIEDLRKLIESPPSFDREQQEILKLLQTLRRAGVLVLLTEPRKKGAAAEWDHRIGTLRIQPKMTEKGSADFLRVLGHEAVHVAQSCMAGDLKARPKTLGLVLANPEQLKQKLSDPVYSDASRWEQALELEAYATQDDSSRIRQLVVNKCKLAMDVAN